MASVLLVEETGVSGENHQPVANHWQTLSHNVVSILFILVTQYSNKISLKICLYNGWYEYANSCKNKNWKKKYLYVKKIKYWNIIFFFIQISFFPIFFFNFVKKHEESNEIYFSNKFYHADVFFMK